MRKLNSVMGLATSLGVIDNEFPVFQAVLTKPDQTVLTLVLVFNMQKTHSALLTWKYVHGEAPKNTGPVE